jgi:hypothetical protein
MNHRIMNYYGTVIEHACCHHGILPWYQQQSTKTLKTKINGDALDSKIRGRRMPRTEVAL